MDFSYFSWCPVLAEDFQEYTSKGGQVFVSTHSPQFLNAIPLESLFLIEKSQGVSRIMPFTADPLVRSQMEAGDHAGYLWDQGVLEGFVGRVER